MSGFIPENTLDDIRSRVDIVEVISDYIQLKKKGRNFVGPCPFHQERDPSFTVSPEKQIFYCFGCAAGGNVFKFLMLHEGFTFQESVETLARRVGVTVSVEGQGDKLTRSRKTDSAIKINTLAKTFFQEVLSQWEEAAPAREYLQGRGLSEETVNNFELGFAPGAWNSLVRHLNKHKVGADALVKLGLAAEGKRGAYDRFRSRIIFPIHDVSGNVVGFGGRVLGSGEPKYLNTPETEYFNKSRVLYGINESRRYIRESGYVIIMEGYMDVIAANQNGVKNAVASLGTSLTKDQVRLLQRYTNDVVIAYDADAAGIAATLRGLDLMQEMGCRVRVISISDGKDPDEFLQAHGAQGWQDLVVGAEPLLEYKFRQIKADVAGKSNDKSAMLQQLLPNLVNIRDDVERAESIKLLATRLHTSWDAIAGEFKRFIEKNRKKRPNSDKITNNKHNTKHNTEQLDARTKAEKMLLRLILENPQLVSTVQKELEENFFNHPMLDRVFKTALPLIERSDYNPAIIFDFLDEDDQKVLGDLLMENVPEAEPVKILPSYIEAMQKFLKRERRESLMDKLIEAEKAGDQKRVSEMLEQLQTLL
ncbi:MAG: DNA primase [Firmicutes bacterium]|nr:DNA primase [Bacillota bacterium]